MTLQIGLSSCFFHADPERPLFKGKTLVYAEESMVQWIHSEGAIAYIIPRVQNDALLDETLKRCDGLLLQGGSDCAPESYGEKPEHENWRGDIERDRYEIDLIKRFLKMGKPILGACRGQQVLNVALGGSLYQDNETHIKASLEHRNWDIYDQNFHDVEVVAGSSFAELYKGVTKAKVNSVHHQSIKDVAKDLEVGIISPVDGIIEAVTYTGPSYARAVQWHPEWQDPERSDLLSSKVLMQDFLRAAGQR